MGCCPKSNSREIITGSSRKVELALGFGAFVIYSQLMQTLIASLVLEIPAAPPETSNRHFVHKLTVETDPSDVKSDLDNGASGFVVIDARSADNYRKAHVPGAKSLPHGTIDADTTADLSKDILLVVLLLEPGLQRSRQGMRETVCPGVPCERDDRRHRILAEGRIPG